LNLREGTRRLALLLGIVGAILGGIVSYIELQSVMHARADHQRFEQLANSQVVQQKRKALQFPPDFIPSPPPGYTLDTATGVPPGVTLSPLPSTVNEGGIETINWSHDFGVQSIETQNGQTLYPTPAPSAWLYLLDALLPILGFFIPWGAIRAIGWVGAGFVQPSR
jgi:hypothetical protein